MYFCARRDKELFDRVCVGLCGCGCVYVCVCVRYVDHSPMFPKMIPFSVDDTLILAYRRDIPYNNQ